MSGENTYKPDGMILDNDGNLVHFGWPIHECNDLCRCNDMCKNRVSVIISLNLTILTLMCIERWFNTAGNVRSI